MKTIIAFFKSLTKRDVLFIVAGAVFVVLGVIAFFDFVLNYGFAGDIFNVFVKYLIIYVMSVFIMLVVYYLSIIASALDKRYKEQEHKEEK